MQQIRFKGEVHLILSDGCKMETKGVVVEARHNTKLHIHSQSEGAGQGKLEVYNDNFELNAALGGTEANNMGSLYIHGGDISVTEIRGYAAIGGGANEELKGGQIDPNSEIVVYGGKLTVNATSCTAGIGGGYFKDQGGPVTIYGGTVDVTGGRSGAGIGGGIGGKGGTVNIYGGKLTARGRSGDSHSGAAIGGGQGAGGGDVHVYGGEVYAYGGNSSSGIGGAYNTHGGTLEVTGGVVYASSCENDQGLAPAIGGGTYSDGVKVIVNGGVLMAVTKQSSSLNPAPIGPGTYLGGHLFYSNAEIHLADNMKVSYSDHQDAIKDAQYREGQYLREVPTASREEACQNHAYTFVRIEGCSHAQYTYVNKDNEKHVHQCASCNVKTEEAHTYKDGKCICGKMEEVSDYWTVTFYYTTDGKTYAKGDEYQVIKGMQTTPPIAPKVDGVTLVGYLPVSGAAPATIEMADSEKTSGQLMAPGAFLEPSANTAYYARYRYNFRESWEWNSDLTEAAVTLTNPLAGDPVKVTATITEDMQQRVEPTEEKLGEAHYTATATYTKSEGITYRFEDCQTMTLRQPRIIILDALDTEGKNAELLERYDGFEAEVIINNLTLKKDGLLHPLCLPFSIANLKGTPLEDAWIYQYMDYSLGTDLNISFTGSSSIEAGRPYFYKFTNKGDDISHPSFSPVIIGDTDGSGKYETNFDLLGTYEIMAFNDEALDQIVVLDDNKVIHRPETVNAFSSYFYIVPNIDADGCRIVTAITLDFTNSQQQFSKKLFDSWAGEGTQASPYIISSAPQLKELQEDFSASSDAARLKGKYFRQKANISFDKTIANRIAPIRNFTAHYDGGGYIISGLNISLSGNQSAGLFATLDEGATVKNVIVQNSSFKGYNSAPIAGAVLGGARVDNCHVLKDVTVEAETEAGGIVAVMNHGASTVSACTSHASVKGYSGVGGIVGMLTNGNVSNSIALGSSVTGTANVNAVVGYRQNGKIENCYFIAPTLKDDRAKLMPQYDKDVDNTDFLTHLNDRDEYLLKAGLAKEQICYDLTLNNRKPLTAVQQTDGTLKRKTYSACLPFEMKIPTELLEDVKVYKLHKVDVDNKVLQFTNEFPILMAGEPYIIVISKGSLSFSATNTLLTASPKEPLLVKNADDSMEMGWWRGTFKKLDNNRLLEENAYLLQPNGTYRCSAERYPNCYISPFVGYFSSMNPLNFEIFKLKFIPTENGGETGDVQDFPADEFDGDFDFNDETAISALLAEPHPQSDNAERPTSNGEFYNLHGQRVANPTKGLYIQNGKKVIIN